MIIVLIYQILKNLLTTIKALYRIKLSEARMLRVTKENVTRFSEDGLCLALADMDQNDPMYDIVEAELVRRDDIKLQLLKEQNERRIESLKLTNAIQEEIAHLFLGIKAAKTLVLIEHLGQEFIDDYVIDEATFTVYSKVKHSIFNNPDSWQYDNITQARSKMAKLIYYRIYDKFMRDASADNLELLKRVLGG